MLPAASIDLSSQPSTLSRLERSDWVDMQLANSFMLDTKRSMPASSVVTWIMAALLYKAVLAIQLVTWLALANLVILFRYFVAIQFQNTMRAVSGPALRTFLNKYDILWILGGLLWGVSALLFFGKATGFEQFICGLILVGVSYFSVYSYFSRLKCYFGFSCAMTSTTLAIFIYRMWVDKSLSSLSDNLVLLCH